MMVTTVVPTRSPSVRNAWLSLLGFPFSFLGAFIVGEGLAGAFGYPAGGDDWPPPALVAVPATTLAILVFGVPAFVSVWYARKASAQGNRHGWVPAGVALGFLAIFVVLNTVPMGQ